MVAEATTVKVKRMFWITALVLTLGTVAVHLTPEVAGEIIASYVFQSPAGDDFGVSEESGKRSRLQDPSLQASPVSGPEHGYGVAAPGGQATASGDLHALSSPIDSSIFAFGPISPSLEARSPSSTLANSAPAETPPMSVTKPGANIAAGQLAEGVQIPGFPDLPESLGLALPVRTAKVSGEIDVQAQRDNAGVVGISRTNDSKTRGSRVEDRRELYATVRLSGKVILDPTAQSSVQSPYPGILQTMDGSYPFVGQRVKRGQILARLLPINDHIKEARLLEEIEELTGETELLRRKAAMLEHVVYVRFRDNKIEELRAKGQTLNRRVAVLKGALSKVYELRAPADGVVSKVNLAVGQFADKGVDLLEIVNMNQVWVRIDDAPAGMTDPIGRATAVRQGGHSVPLDYLGGGMTLGDQRLPIQFNVAGDNHSLRVGDEVDIVAQIGRKPEYDRQLLITDKSTLDSGWSRRKGTMTMKPGVRAVLGVDVSSGTRLSRRVSNQNIVGDIQELRDLTEILQRLQRGGRS